MSSGVFSEGDDEIQDYLNDIDGKITDMSKLVRYDLLPFAYGPLQEVGAVIF